MQFGTNHLGHFALTNLLLPHVTGRVVTVASEAHRWWRSIHFDDFNLERRTTRRWRAYGQSKLANLLFTLELQRRLSEAGSPVRGRRPPRLRGHQPPEPHGQPCVPALMLAGNRLFAQSDEPGALPTLYAAVADLPGAATSAPTAWARCAATPRRVAQPRRGRPGGGAPAVGPVRAADRDHVPAGRVDMTVAHATTLVACASAPSI